MIDKKETLKQQIDDVLSSTLFNVCFIVKCHLLYTLMNNNPVDFSELSLYFDVNKQQSPYLSKQFFRINIDWGTSEKT